MRPLLGSPNTRPAFWVCARTNDPHLDFTIKLCVAMCSKCKEDIFFDPRLAELFPWLDKTPKICIECAVHLTEKIFMRPGDMIKWGYNWEN